jgi:hypothetical protein
MLDLEKTIAVTRKKTSKLQRILIKECLSEYLVTLTTGNRDIQVNGDMAILRARATLKGGLFSPEWLQVISGEAAIGDHFAGRVALAFESVTLPLQVPDPTRATGPKVWAVAMWACIGAAVGMLILTPIARLALDMRDLGLALGGPIGAFCFVLIYWRLARARLILGLISRIRGTEKKAPAYDLKAHERVVHAAMEKWLHAAIGMLVVVCSDKSLFTQDTVTAEKVLKRLSGKIYALHHTSGNALSVAADELILEAKNCGFEGLDGPPSFLESSPETRQEFKWRKGMAQQYELFGHVTEGDRVWVQRKPVVLDGTVIERGLVRKVRT